MSKPCQLDDTISCQEEVPRADVEVRDPRIGQTNYTTKFLVTYVILSL